MMFRLITLVMVLHSGFALGQGTQEGNVFILSKEFAENTCEAIAQCDCCSADLFLLPTHRFALVSRCLSGDTYWSGSYSEENGKLKLAFDQKYMEEESDETYKITGYQLRESNRQPLEFDLVPCGKKMRLICPESTERKNGSRYAAPDEKAKLKKLKAAIAWRQLTQ